MKYRKLRNAWSVGWGVVATLVIVLWVRSNWWFDQYAGPGSNATYCGYTSVQGRVLLGKSNDPMLPTVLGTRWIWRQWDKATNRALFPASVPSTYESVLLPWIEVNPNYYIQNGTSYEVVLPHWLFVVPFAILAAASWVRWRFSLRTLLIATTLVAILLGLIVWLR